MYHSSIAIILLAKPFVKNTKITQQYTCSRFILNQIIIQDFDSRAPLNIRFMWTKRASGIPNYLPCISDEFNFK